MAQGELKYTIAAQGNNFANTGANIGVRVDAILTYDMDHPNSNGTFNVTGASGTYDTVDVNGNVVSHDIITGVGPLQSYGFADNRIDTRGIGHYFVDGGGIALNIDHPADTLQGTGTVNLYVPSSDSYAEISGSNPVNSISFNGQAVGPVGDIPVCFVAGTLIRTVRGDVPVDELQVGDVAATASGEFRPIVWVGHRAVDCASHRVPSEVWPVRIRAGAFGADLPERDLLLSPGHPVLVRQDADEMLVPIMCLINGTSVARVPCDRVTYWHVELDRHDILLAEGLPAESFLDYGNRPWFENAVDHELANPDHTPAGLDGRCRPVVLGGPVVEAERRRLDALFAMDLACHCAWPRAGETSLALG